MGLMWCRNGPPTRDCSEGGLCGRYGWEMNPPLAFGARMGSVGVNTAHRLAFAARVGRMNEKWPHRLAFGARVGPWA
jgi:hypothetical protein